MPPAGAAETNNPKCLCGLQVVIFHREAHACGESGEAPYKWKKSNAMFHKHFWEDATIKYSW